VQSSADAISRNSRQSNRGTVFSVRSVTRYYKQDSWSCRKVTLILTSYRKDCSEDLSTFVMTYSLFQSGRLRTNIKLTLLNNALIRSVMVYACPTWEYAVDANLWKLQRLQNGQVHTSPRIARDPKNLLRVWLHS
jgi:hypothetical protein